MVTGRSRNRRFVDGRSHQGGVDDHRVRTAARPRGAGPSSGRFGPLGEDLLGLGHRLVIRVVGLLQPGVELRLRHSLHRPLGHVVVPGPAFAVPLADDHLLAWPAVRPPVGPVHELRDTAQVVHRRRVDARRLQHLDAAVHVLHRFVATHGLRDVVSVEVDDVLKGGTLFLQHLQLLVGTSGCDLFGRSGRSVRSAGTLSRAGDLHVVFVHVRFDRRIRDVCVVPQTVGLHLFQRRQLRQPRLLLGVVRGFDLLDQPVDLQQGFVRENLASSLIHRGQHFYRSPLGSAQRVQPRLQFGRATAAEMTGENQLISALINACLLGLLLLGFERLTQFLVHAQAFCIGHQADLEMPPPGLIGREPLACLDHRFPVAEADVDIATGIPARLGDRRVELLLKFTYQFVPTGDQFRSHRVLGVLHRLRPTTVFAEVGGKFLKMAVTRTLRLSSSATATGPSSPGSSARSPTASGRAIVVRPARTQAAHLIAAFRVGPVMLVRGSFAGGRRLIRNRLRRLRGGRVGRGIVPGPIVNGGIVNLRRAADMFDRMRCGGLRAALHHGVDGALGAHQLAFRQKRPALV